MKIKYPRALTALAVFSAVALIFLTALPVSQKTQAAGTISGRVFQDYNSNGVYDTTGGFAVDTGVSGVTVTVYDAGGTARGSTTSAATTGMYSVTATGTGPYRVEFTNLPTGYEVSAHSTDSAATRTATNAGSSIQFVPDGTTGDVNLAVNRPVEYCQNNPTVCIPQSTLGNVDGNALKSFPYSYTADADGNIGSTAITGAPSRNTAPDPTTVALNNSIGTVFGLAYNGATKNLYASAYIKRDAKLGSLSTESTGAIYVKNTPAAATPAATVFVNLNVIFGATTAGTNPHPTSGTTVWTGTTPDAATTPVVGKVGLGGLKLSQDGLKLYAVNLADRRLYVIPTNVTPTSSNILRYTIPTANLTTAGGTCPPADVRPFALGRDLSGSIYVGAVCSGESSLANTFLQAYVWRFNEDTTFTLVASNGLNFNRVSDSPTNFTWNYWDNTSNVLNRAEPMLTDIEFDRGSMVLGFRDRYGDQSDQAANPNFYRGYGDIMRACVGGIGWNFESNGGCGGVNTAGAGTSAGNGGGEFYLDLNGDGREEGLSGGLFQIPGFNHILTTAYDPVSYNSSGTRISNYYTAGVQRYNNTTGVMAGAYDVYLRTDSDTFGKANGVGDIEALCDKAPVEIGNRVWRDTNGDGVQTPGEAGIAGVTVNLYSITVVNGNTVYTKIGTAVTDANGEYYFSSATGTNSTSAIYGLNLLPSANYSIRIDLPANYSTGGPLAGLTATSSNVSSQNGFADGSDSDGVNTTNPAGSPSGTFPVINITTGTAGQNNHTQDFGFRTGATAARVEVSGRVLDAKWKGIGGARVTLTTQSGTVLSVGTNQFGYFTFRDVEGQSAVLSASAKGKTFSQSNQFVSLTESSDNTYFIANQ